MISYLPSPSTGVWWLGPVPLRGYALCILAGIVVAVWVCGRRLVERGWPSEEALTVAYWAVPFGILGGRIYHLITTPQPYFGAHGHPLDAFKIWHGGLGIWGAVALGAVGAWIGCRRAGIPFLAYADAAAPGILVAQAMGRWGNYFNNELYGGPTTLPWGLQIHEWDATAGRAAVDAAGHPIVLPDLYQPTFLYESFWCLLIALAIVLIDRRRLLGRGRSFALYIALYPVGRIVFELMRSDPANHILGLRVNVWVSVIVFLIGAGLFVLLGRRHPDGVPRTPYEPAARGAGEGDPPTEQGAAAADGEGPQSVSHDKT